MPIPNKKTIRRQYGLPSIEGLRIAKTPSERNRQFQIAKRETENQLSIARESGAKPDIVKRLEKKRDAVYAHELAKSSDFARAAPLYERAGLKVFEAFARELAGSPTAVFALTAKGLTEEQARGILEAVHLASIPKAVEKLKQQNFFNPESEAALHFFIGERLNK